MGELEVHNLTKRIANRLVVDRVSFHVNDGEFFVILGPEQSGKTMLLRLISGLEDPDAGSIILNGRDITYLPAGQRNIGMAFQSTRVLQDRQNVYDSIAAVLKNQGVPASGVEMHVISVAHMLDIKHLLKRKVANLSGGELQRVALARVLVRKAQLYLFDEPLTHLEIRDRHRAWQQILMAHRLQSQSSIYTTREPSEALAIADRIAVFAYGRIHQVGKASELLDMPANVFVAQFVHIPPMNILHGYLQAIYRQSGLRYRVLIKGLTIWLPPRWNHVLQRCNSSDILLGIRPASILPEKSFADLETREGNISQALVIEVEYHAKRTSVRLRLPDGEELVALLALAPYERLTPGQVITIGIDTEQLCLFHPLTRLLIQQD
ncbi:MAG: ABC transporter ATP-binding protein [Ktedonobacteraceae bacterium]|nr:ABC transporter ATP-binding protein [Ktedonobacteraceae bacterium]